MIRNDLHVHTIQSPCGFHTLMEVVEIANSKGMRLVNISDHGSAIRNEINFGVLVNRSRLPDPVVLPSGESILVLRGIEANIVNKNGNTDIPENLISRFDLITLGFHYLDDMPLGWSEDIYTKAMIKAVGNNPIDLFAHPCVEDFPISISVLIDLAVKYGFALEVNNEKLQHGSTDLERLKQVVSLALQKKVALVETSDGHTYKEIGENDKIEEFLAEMKLDGDKIFLNRHDKKFEEFVAQRKSKRQKN